MDRKCVRYHKTRNYPAGEQQHQSAVDGGEGGEEEVAAIQSDEHPSPFLFTESYSKLKLFLRSVHHCLLSWDKHSTHSDCLSISLSLPLSLPTAPDFLQVHWDLIKWMTKKGKVGKCRKYIAGNR